MQGAPDQVKSGALAVLAEAYAQEIDRCRGEDRHVALRDLGPKLHACLTALGTGARLVPGVSDAGSDAAEESPSALSPDELAARRQGDALARLQQSAKRRRSGA